MNKKLLASIIGLTTLLPACGDTSSDDATSSTSESSEGSASSSASSTTSSEASSSDSTGDGDGDSTGDGDGDSTGDGDGDSTGDGDGDSTGDGDTTGDGDGDTTGDGDGDTTGDGDGDTTGDGDGDTTGDGDGDTTGDGDGDTTGNPDDDDNDGIPNDDDPFPNDPTWPGTGQPNVVYAHTSSQLFTMNVNTYEVNSVGNFSFDSSAGQITDIALDRWGVLYAVSFYDVFVCNAGTAECKHLGDLPLTFNGLTMVPPGTIDADDDTLIGIANNGSWHRIDAAMGQATVTNIGGYGGSYTNAGDVFSIQGVGTYGAVNGVGGNDIVVCDPVTGVVQSVLANTAGYSSLYGLAGWNGSVFGFNSGGEIIRIDPDTGVVTELADTPYSWWGAGVFSILPE